MAEAVSSFKKQLDDQLTCTICLDQYTNPKTLPCHHSFCFECIQQLPVEIKNGKNYISCPTCRVDHLVPQGGAINLPNDFKINSLLDLQKKSTVSKMTQQTTSSTICHKHNEPLKVYCETCCQVICCECTISGEHNEHDFYLISECYPKHHQQILESLDLVEHKLTDVNTAITHLATREREVLQQGQQLKEQINTHAQQIIAQVQRSCTCLSQQVDTIVQQKTQVLKAQKQQAQKLQTQLETYQEMTERSLKEWTKQQVLTEKRTMMDELNAATQNVDPAVLQPEENANIRFLKTDAIENEIGAITTQIGAISFSTKPVGDDASPFTLSVVAESKITGVKAPRGIAMYNNGAIVVAEWSANCITILNKERRKVRSFSGVVACPCGVAISNNVDIIVTDNHQLHKLTTDGVCVKSVGSSNSGSGRLQFNCPQGIAVHPTTEQIFVADSENNRIQVFTNDLTFSHTITLRFSKKLDTPYDVALDNEGYLYVAEFNNHCITKLTTAGQYITRFGSEGSAPGQLSHPSSLTINNKLVYVSEWGNSRVSTFNTTGKFLHCFGKYGSGEGKFKEPRGIIMDTSGNLYVSDTWNNRIVVYKA